MQRFPVKQDAHTWGIILAHMRIYGCVEGNLWPRQPPAELDTASDDSDQAYRLDLALPGLDQGPEALYARSVVLEALQRALDELPPNQRGVFIGHELECSSFKEMAMKSGTAVNTLLARKRSAILHLRARLQSVYDDLDL
jgi:DNA-directed RNA polymerase specialized sigma24 family protein